MLSDLPGLDSSVAEHLSALQREMEKRFPNPKTVSDSARQLSPLLDQWAAQFKGQAFDEAKVQSLLATLAGKKDADPSWDLAAQQYLGLAALHHGLSDLNGRYKMDTGLKRAIENYRITLDGMTPRGEPDRFDSPRDFAPDVLKEKMAGVLEQLHRLGPK